MKIFNDIHEWLIFRQKIPTAFTLGFAPTMGNLHPGHLSLFTTSKTENALTATSLFINPTQFNNPNDFTHYPRTIEHDLGLLEEAGVDYCLLPTKQAIYPDNYTYQVHEQNFSHHLEGAHRPGHFTGVLTVVMKLLNIIKPHRAYFGEKDYQQFTLIKGMADAFFMDIDIKSCPTIRESSGLAYSSRNNRLSAKEKKQAEAFARIFGQDKPCSLLQDELEQAGIMVEYLEKFQGRRYAAVQIGEIRLIDNHRCSRKA